MIGATSLLKVTLAASFLFAINATVASRAPNRIASKRFISSSSKFIHKATQNSAKVFSLCSFVWLCGEFWLLATRTGSLGSRLPQILFVEGVIEITDHHLFPGLRSPAH